MKKYLKCGYAIDEGRLAKAKKIEAVLKDYLGHAENSLFGKKIIDIGCGSGQIAAYFSEYNDVLATDVVDQLSDDVKRKIKFAQFENEILPFSEGEFDIAILNHAIAHTKNKSQLLSEIYRILKKGGLCYIANPNRFYPIEPYYKIPLLQYLPDNLFLKAARILGRNKEDVYLVSFKSLKNISQRSRFQVDDYTIKVLNQPERYSSEFSIPYGIKLPEAASILSPTNIFVLIKKV